MISASDHFLREFFLWSLMFVVTLREVFLSIDVLFKDSLYLCVPVVLALRT